LEKSCCCCCCCCCRCYRCNHHPLLRYESLIARLGSYCPQAMFTLELKY
jgi:hypothetical protein